MLSGLRVLILPPLDWMLRALLHWLMGCVSSCLFKEFLVFFTLIPLLVTVTTNVSFQIWLVSNLIHLNCNTFKFLYIFALFGAHYPWRGSKPRSSYSQGRDFTHWAIAPAQPSHIIALDRTFNKILARKRDSIVCLLYLLTGYLKRAIFLVALPPHWSYPLS